MNRKLSVVLPSGGQLTEYFFSQSLLSVANDLSIEFISQLSKEILRSPEFRPYPELMAMGFWMRKHHIEEILNKHISESGDKIRLPRGVVFHIAPSNVDTIFVYSWLLSMLMGNINIVRLSSKGGIQINLLLKLLNNLLKKSKYKDIASRQLLITYERDSKVTSYLSAHCDTRVIWGGDDTVNTIRKFPIPPAATDLVFPDKFSISLIGVSKFENLDENSKIKLVKSFINDAFWFGQMACSSPRLILWLGNSELIEETKKDFWARVDDLLDVDFAKISTADIVNKLVTSHSLAINSNINIIKTKNNLVNRINLYSLEKMDTNLHCGGGLFYEFSIEQLGDMIPFVSRKIQTIGYFGVMEEEIKQFITEHTPKGIDRFVPIGEALDFSPIWDGYNFLYEFTRTVDVKS